MLFGAQQTFINYTLAHTKCLACHFNTITKMEILWSYLVDDDLDLLPHIAFRDMLTGNENSERYNLQSTMYVNTSSSSITEY